MITKELENHLSQLESSLQDYSFDTLGIRAAISLKQKFEAFRNELHSKSTMVSANNIMFTDGLKADSQMTKVNYLIGKVLKEVQSLKKKDVDNKQCEAIANIELASLIILHLSMKTSGA